MGHNVKTFDLTRTPYWIDLRHILPFYAPKGIPVSVASVLKTFNESFDLIIEFDGTGQYHLSGYDKTDIPALYWALDVYRSDNRKFHLTFIKDFCHIFIAQNDYLAEYSKYNPNCTWLTYACDPEIHRKINTKKIYDIVFIGSTDPKGYPERVKLLERLGKKFKLNIFKGVYGEAMVKIYNQAKIVFNKTAGSEINIRIFETLACGTMLLTDKITNGLQNILKDKMHLVMYDENNLEELAAFYLNNNDKREQIALSGYNEVTAKHTFINRAQEILSKISKN